MNIKGLTFLLVAFLWSAIAMAYDFSAAYNGDIFYYNITSSVRPRTVEVTFEEINYTRYCEYSGSIEIPSKVKHNGKTYSVTSIGDEALYFCRELTSITIPSSVTSIGSLAFSYCGLTFIGIPNSVTSIGTYAFSSCDSLTYVTISNSVTSIEEGTFSRCRELTFVDIPNSVTSIGKYAFSKCSKLTFVDIPNSVTSIGDEAFGDCHSLTSVAISNSVASIENEAFVNCYDLTAINIPESVTFIGSNVFRACSSLRKITVNWKVPLPVSYDQLGIYNSNIRLIIPYGTYEQYSTAEGWEDFKIEEVNYKTRKELEK